MKKPRRDITLGEMQDECKRRGARCIVDGECKFHSICKSMNINGYLRNIQDWDLTDPPRFTEAQMAFLKGCYEIGIVGIMRSGDGSRTHFFTKFETIGWLKNSEIPLETGETLDLAELLGKDNE